MTGTKRESTVQRGQVCGLKSSRSGWRVAESAGELRRCVGGDGEDTEKREERFERTRRTWMDMAGVKTFDLLVGVVLVLQCVRNVHAEIATSYGKKSQLQHRVRRGVAAGSRCGPAHRQSQVESGTTKSCKRALSLHRNLNALVSRCDYASNAVWNV